LRIFTHSLFLNRKKEYSREDKVKLLVKNGGHCHYLPTFEENGENSFAKIVADYIES